ncbi:MAG: hypothetical protein MZU95_15885 [Desulfomicrobium escambiense]|nr:hypothetical protein [Desulfomicrobium escambiense]
MLPGRVPGRRRGHDPQPRTRLRSPSRVRRGLRPGRLSARHVRAHRPGAATPARLRPVHPRWSGARSPPTSPARPSPGKRPTAARSKPSSCPSATATGPTCRSSPTCSSSASRRPRRTSSPEGPGRVIALFNGTDHVEPRAEVPENLDAALAGQLGWSWEFGDLEGFVRQILAARPPQSRHRGELRSACRTLILPSVASARLYLEKQNFDCETLLARQAEPLAALGLAAGGADFSGLLSYAWGLLLENHPHDSICGCSVDAVHDEMETRFAKAMQAGRRVLTESLFRLAPRLSPGLLVFNPAGPRPAGAMCGELSARLKKPLALALPEGEAPVQTLEILENMRQLTNQILPREAGMILLGELVTYELFGLYLQSVEITVRATLWK